MSSDGRAIDGFPLRRCIPALVVLFATAWWTSAAALAQDAAPDTLKITGGSILTSPEGEGFKSAPYLVIGMADGSDALPYRALPFALENAANPPPRDTRIQRIGPSDSADSREQLGATPLVLSSLPDPRYGVQSPTDFRVKPESFGQTIRRSPDLPATLVDSSVDDRSGSGAFLYEDEANSLRSTQWLADKESITDGDGEAPSPLLQLRFGNWRFPILLSSVAVSQ